MLRMLVVDDDAGIRQVIIDFLGLCCPDVEVVGQAADGTEAVAMAAALDPDVIIIDVRMPIMDGIEATRQIKRRRGLAATVITCSSFTTPAIELVARRAGATAHLAKPFRLADLQAAIYGVTAVA